MLESALCIDCSHMRTAVNINVWKFSTSVPNMLFIYTFFYAVLFLFMLLFMPFGELT